MRKSFGVRPIQILLVEDNPGDARLTVEALKQGKVLNTMATVSDGEQAMAYLRRQGEYHDATRPDLILLDLNMPRKNGQEVLAEIKADATLKTIPVVVMTTSRADEDILASYQLNANCYVTKPVDTQKFADIVKSVEDFWLSIVTLPGMSVA